MNEFEIRYESDHYVGYVNGEFACSGDTINEVRTTLLEIVFPEV